MYDYHGWIACSVVLYFSSSNGRFRDHDGGRIVGGRKFRFAS